MEGEVLLASDWREAGDRYGVGSLVTRDGTDVQRVISLDGDRADTGEFECLKAPDSGWCKVGDIEFNLTRRYDPVEPPPKPGTVMQGAGYILPPEPYQGPTAPASAPWVGKTKRRKR